MNGRSRYVFLGLVGLTLVVAAAKWAIAPSYRTVSPIRFPDQMALGEGQAIGQRQLSEQVEEPSRYDRVLSGQSYHYVYQQASIHIELRDVFTTTGDVGQYFNTQLYLNLESGDVHDHASSTGFYRVVTTSQRRYLSSCIGESGQTTVTPDQFRHNRYRQVWQGDRLWRWLLGQTALLEYRCLWVVLSTPIDRTQPERSQTLLEAVWQQNWQQWHTLHNNRRRDGGWGVRGEM